MASRVRWHVEEKIAVRKIDEISALELKDSVCTVQLFWVVKA